MPKRPDDASKEGEAADRIKYTTGGTAVGGTLKLHRVWGQAIDGTLHQSTTRTRERNLLSTRAVKVVDRVVTDRRSHGRVNREYISLYIELLIHRIESRLFYGEVLSKISCFVFDSLLLL